MEITKGNQAILRFRASPDSSRLVYFLSTPTKIGDLFWLDRVSGEARQLTHSNEELFGNLNLTPMMFILGENDSRTPSGAGGEQMFRALKFRQIPTVMVKFPNETH